MSSNFNSMNRVTDRMSAFFNSKISALGSSQAVASEKPNQVQDDSQSATSEISVAFSDWATTNSDSFKLPFGFSSSTSQDISVDELLKGLYLDPDILERNCTLAAKGESIRDCDTKDATSSVSDAEVQQRQLYAINKSVKTVLENLPEAIYTPNYDPVRSTLVLVSTWNHDQFAENFMKKIEETDTDKDFIISKLAELIQCNYSELNACMKDVDFIETDVLQADLQIRTARRHIQTSSDLLARGVMRIVQLHKKKENITLIMDTLKSLKNMKDLYQLMLSLTTTGEFSKASDCALNIIECLQEGVYSKFEALTLITTSIQKNLIVLRQKCDKSLQRLCDRKFTCVEYDSVIEAYVTLDYMREILGCQSANPRDVEEHSSRQVVSKILELDSMSCVGSLSTRIFQYIKDELPSVTQTLIVEIIHHAQYKQHLASQHKTQEIESIFNLNENDLPQLYSKITPDLIASFICHLCGRLTDFIYTYYVINQWHRNPFDKRNQDFKFINTNNFMYNDYIKNPIRNPLKSFNQFVRSVLANPNTDYPKSISNTNINETQSAPSSSTRPVPKAKNDGENSTNPFDDDESDDVSEEPVDSERKEKNSLNTFFVSESDDNVFDDNETEASVDYVEIDYSYEYRNLHSGSIQSNASLSSDSYSNNCISSFKNQRVLSFSTYRLNKAYQSLTSNRILLWELIKGTLINVLSSLSFSASIPLDDYLIIVWAINTMITIGHQFCGAKSTTLIQHMKLNTKEYFSRVHLESYHIMRQMIENESWYNIPINIDDFGGTLGIVRKHLVSNRDSSFGVHSMTGLKNDSFFSIRNYLREDEFILPVLISNTNGLPLPSTAAETSPKFYSFLTFYHIYGNPFYFKADETTSPEEYESVHYKPLSPAQSLESSPRPIEKLESVAAVAESGHDIQNNDAVDSGEDDVIDDDTAILQNLVNDSAISVLTREFFSMFSSTYRSKSLKLNSNKWPTKMSVVVTQTAMNGLAKYAGKYLQMMYTMPSASNEIIRDFCQLFDYYFCAVFVLFVPTDEKQKLLSTQHLPKMVASPPDESRDFEEFHAFIMRALNDVILSEVSQTRVHSPTQDSSKEILENHTDHIHMSTKPEAIENLSAGGDNNLSTVQYSTEYIADSAAGLSSSVMSSAVSGLSSASAVSSSIASNMKSALSSSLSATFALSNTLTPSSLPTIPTLSLPMNMASTATNSTLAGLTAATATLSSSNQAAPSALTTDAPISSHQINSPPFATRTVDGIKVNNVLKVPEAIHRLTFDAPSLYGLHSRIVAAESCWFASDMLSEISSKMLEILPESYHRLVESHTQQYQLVAGQLRGLVYRSMCPVVIKANSILVEIIDSSCAWDSKRIRDAPHDWVDMLTVNCKEVWTFLSHDELFAESTTLVREQVWLEVCQAAFDVVLEGFSRIKKCSTEGRANMSMDVQCLQYNLDAIHSCKPPRGKHHVDAFIRASYMPEDDMLQWIRENWRIYAYRHMHGLLTLTLSSVLRSKKLREAVAVIDELYQETTDETSKLGAIFSMRLTDSNGKIGNLISKSLRTG